MQWRGKRLLKANICTIVINLPLLLLNATATDWRARLGINIVNSNY